MKDARHHLKYVQKKAIHAARHEKEPEGSPINHFPVSSNVILEASGRTRSRYRKHAPGRNQSPL